MLCIRFHAYFFSNFSEAAVGYIQGLVHAAHPVSKHIQRHIRKAVFLELLIDTKPCLFLHELRKFVREKLDPRDISVDTDVSTVVALVINELLQNAYKYAFPGRKDGNVHIELNNGSLYPLLTVADDGVGFDVSSATGAGMGYRIINMLVQNNLGSQLDVRSGPEGTRVTFGFHLR